MKRKFLSILLILVLACSFSLVTAVPAGAQGSEEITLVGTGDGIAEWTTDPVHAGDYSIHLKAPGKFDWTPATTYSDALIQIPLEGTTLEGLTLNEIVGMSWWNYLVNGYPPALRIKLDVDADGESEYHLVAEFAYQEWDESGFAYTGTPWVPYTHYKGGLEVTNDFYYPTYDTWMQTFHTIDDVSGARPADTVTNTVDSNTIFWVMVVEGIWDVDWHSAPYTDRPSYFATLNDYQTSAVSNLNSSATLPILGDAEVLMLEFAITNEIGPDVDPAGHEVYFDDLTINGEPYALEWTPVTPIQVDDDRVQFPDAPFQTIQGAIDAASPNDTINVAAGAYAESVTIGTDNLTITGDISQPAITGGLKFDTDLTDLTLENFYVTGNAVVGKNSIVRMYGAIADLTIDNCVFDGENIPARLGFSGGQLEGDVSITSSEFKNILGWPVLESKSGSGGDGSAMGTVTFADNDVYDCNGTVVFRGLSTDWTDNVYVYENTFQNIGEAGVSNHWAAFEVNRAHNVEIYDNQIRNVVECSWGEGQAMQLWMVGTVDIYANTIEDNYQGITFLKWPADETYDISGISIYDNSFSGNAQYALSVEDDLTGGPLDAENNWWGDVAGPADAAQNSLTGYEAYGNAVFGLVDYEPWLLVEDGPTYDKTLALKDGWTLVSTNKAVANTTFGVDTAEVLKYAVENGTPVWGTVTVADLEPVDVLCIKTDGGGGIGINYADSQAGVSSKALLAGWNLISSGTEETAAYDVLSPLPFAEIGGEQAVGLTTLVSQGDYNQFSGGFYQATLQTSDWTKLQGITLVPFDGYWIQMNAASDFGVITD